MTTTTKSATKSTKQSKKPNGALQKAKNQGSLKGLNHTDIKSVMESFKGQIAEALPRHLDADRMIQISTTLIRKNPEIANCSIQSLMGAVMQASILGFKPLESLGYCYFVPYKGAVQFQIGYKGYIQLARQSGEIKMIYAETVHENDHFEYALGLEPKLEHKPSTGNRGALTHAYAVAHYKDGGYNFMVLSKKEIEDIRVYSPMQNRDKAKGAWATEHGYKQMAKGKTIKQMSKYMPLSEEMEQGTQTDEAVFTGRELSDDNTGIREEELIHNVEELEEEPEPETEQEPQPEQTNEPEPQPEQAEPKTQNKPKTGTAQGGNTKKSATNGKMNFNQ